MPPYAALLPPTCYLAVSQCSVSGFSWCRNYLNGQFLFWSIAYLVENCKGLQKYFSFLGRILLPHVYNSA